MPDWVRLVRPLVPPLGLPPADEAAVIEELAQLCADAFSDQHPAGAGEAEARRFVVAQAAELARLADELGSRGGPPRGAADPPANPRPSRSSAMSLLHRISEDVRFAVRTLAKRPGFTALAVLTLGLGVGLNAAVFSIVNAILLRPAPVTDLDRLVNVYTREDEAEAFLSHVPMAYPDVLDLAAQSTTLGSVAGWAQSSFAVARGGESERLLGEIVTGNYFETLGVGPFLGRTLSPADDRPGSGAPVVVLSHATWRTLFAGDPAVVGRQLGVNGQQLTVVGVARPGYAGLTPGLPSALWVPLQLTRTLTAPPSVNFGDATVGLARLDDRALRWLWVTARLAPETAFATAAAEVDAIAARLRSSHPDTNRDRAVSLLPSGSVRVLPGGVDDALRAFSFALLAVVSLVLLIAAANVASMLLARAADRRREMATRLSLGARPRALVRQLLVEGLVLAAAGALLGVLFAAVANRVVERLSLPLPVHVALDLGIDWRVLLFAAAAAGLAALTFGLAPALTAARTDLATVLREESAAAVGSRRRRLRAALVVAQVALSLVLMVGAGLSLRSLGNAHRIDPGFRADGVVVATLSAGLAGYESEGVSDYYRRLGERASALPGVERVAFTSHLPLSLQINTETLTREGESADQEGIDVDQGRVSPGFFEVLGIPLLRGRDFRDDDTPESPRVAVVNESLARRLWPGGESLGRRLVVAGVGPHEVVGVVRDVKVRSLGEAPRPFLYLSFGQSATGTRILVARHQGDPRTVLGALGGLAREVDPRVPRSDLETLEESIGSALLLPRLSVGLFGLLGVLGLTLSAVGIYGVIACAVAQRTREVGLRMALGARGADVLRLVLGEGLALIAVGTTLGIVAAVAASSALGAILYGISPTDVPTFAGVTLLLALVALLAAWIPARRAASLDPVQALRH